MSINTTNHTPIQIEPATNGFIVTFKNATRSGLYTDLESLQADLAAYFANPKAVTRFNVAPQAAPQNILDTIAQMRSENLAKAQEAMVAAKSTPDAETPQA